MEPQDKQMVACHISVIANNLKHINKALEKDIVSDTQYALLDELIEDIHLRLEEIEYTLHVWDLPHEEPNHKWEGYKNGWAACEEFYEKQDRISDAWCSCGCGPVRDDVKIGLDDDGYNHRMD